MIRNLNKIKLLAIFTLIVNFAFSQSNKPCNGAPNLNVNSTCSYITGTTVGATQQTNPQNFGTPSCGSMGADVWYSFTAPASGSVTITTQAGVVTDGVMALYSSDCAGTSTELDCDDDGGTGLMPEISQGGLTPGQTYYIRFWEYAGDNNGTFDICVVEAAPPPGTPANDEPCSATPLPVNPDQACGTVTAATAENATETGGVTNSCGGTADDDVWFSFVATSTVHNVDILNATGTTDMYHNVYSGGCTSGSLTNLSCNDGDATTIGGLTPGQTYYVQVYTWSSFGNNTGFDICIGTPPPPGPNDDPCNAIPVTVNPDQLCGSVTTSTTASASQTSGVTNSCWGTADDDVWFYFVATDVFHEVSVLNANGTSTDMYHAVYSGGCTPGSLTNLTCNDGDVSTVSGLTIGQTYYIQVYTYYSGDNASFDLCIGSVIPTCSDGIMNQDETNIDCGGVCPACATPTVQDCDGAIPVCQNVYYRNRCL